MQTNDHYTIKESMCDCFRRLKLQYMFMMMQDAAYKDLESYGFGRKSLLDKDIAFLLRRSVAHVIKPTYADEEIIVGTSQVAQSGMTYTRDYIFTCNNEVRVKATSQWFLCRISDKTLLRPILITKSYKEDAVDINIGSKPETDLYSFEQYDTVKAGYSSVDGNMHVNNTEYISWVCNAPNVFEYLKRGSYKFDIYFKREVIPADTVVLKQKDDLICGISKDNISFIAQFK
ncbi:MAG: acyl-ACP thioesterase domain-containing protein [Clostridia bacterium]|jgi:acyl-ACP thioesterase